MISVNKIALISAMFVAHQSGAQAALCGQLGLQIGPIEYAAENGVPDKLNLDPGNERYNAPLDITFESNGVEQIVTNYEVVLSTNGGASHDHVLGTVAANVNSGSFSVSAADVCGGASCCRAYIADCMACSEGVSPSVYCKSHPEVVGCEDATQNTFCCLAENAQCNACHAGVDVVAYCRSKASGSEEVRGCAEVLADVAQERTLTASVLLRSPPVLGCPYTAVSKTFDLVCPPVYVINELVREKAAAATDDTTLAVTEEVSTVDEIGASALVGAGMGITVLMIGAAVCALVNRTDEDVRGTSIDQFKV